MEQLEIDEPLYPTWLPDGFTREYFVIEMDPIFLHEGYSNGDRYLSITIEPQSQIGITNYQKDLNQPIEYTVRGITHFIVSDTSSYTATWQTERHLVQITGNISLEEMEQIINSVYGVEK